MDFHTETNSGGSREPDGESPRSSGTSTEFDLSDPVNSFVVTARAIALTPVDFFGGMRRQGDFVNPLVFVIICFEVFALAGGLAGLVGALIRADEGFLGALISFLLFVLLMPVVGAGVVFGSAAIYHLVAYLIIKPSTSGFEATFRVLAYVSVVMIPLAAVALVAWIPVLGPVLNIVASFAATAYALFLTVVGIREVHETTTGKAVLVMVIPSVVSFLILLIPLLAGAGALFFFTR